MTGRLYIRELQVVYRSTTKPRNGIRLEKVRTPPDVVAAFDFLKALPREVFVAVLLDTGLNVLGYETISIGTESASLINPTCAFRAAVITGATNVIFIHNHPTGDPAPSTEDYAVARRLKDAASTLGLGMRDFIVLGNGAYTSLASNGQL